MDRKTSTTTKGVAVTRARGARGAGLIAVLVGVGALGGGAAPAAADEVAPTGKGIAGGILLGGEVVTITESLAGVRAGWAYLLGGGLGAAAGGVGGFAIEQASADGQGATYLLAGGMALIIPALVLTLNATRYHPSEDATEDKPPPGLPADPGVPGGTSAPATNPVVVPAPTGATPAPPPPPTSLLDLSLPQQVGLRLGVPVPDVRPMYSSIEQKTYGLPQHAEVRMPVFRLTF